MNATELLLVHATLEAGEVALTAMIADRELLRRKLDDLAAVLSALKDDRIDLGQPEPPAAAVSAVQPWRLVEAARDAQAAAAHLLMHLPDDLETLRRRPAVKVIRVEYRKLWRAASELLQYNPEPEAIERKKAKLLRTLGRPAAAPDLAGQSPSM